MSNNYLEDLSCDRAVGHPEVWPARRRYRLVRQRTSRIPETGLYGSVSKYYAVNPRRSDSVLEDGCNAFFLWLQSIFEKMPADTVHLEPYRSALTGALLQDVRFRRSMPTTPCRKR